MIIDSHVHVWTVDERSQPPLHIGSPPRMAAPIEWLVQDMAEFHIDHCVIIQGSGPGWDNSYMFDCLERYPGKFKAIGLVNPMSERNAGDLRDLMARGLSGVRLHPLYYQNLPCWIDTPAHDRLWDVAADTGAILQYHMLPWHAVPLARMIERHPDVRVIVDHIGKPDVAQAPPYPSFQPVLDLARYPFVWVKLGDYQAASRQSFPWPDLIPFIAALKDAFGTRRMIWGTGYPRYTRIIRLADALRWVRQELPCLSPADVDQMLGSTPKELFGF